MSALNLNVMQTIQEQKQTTEATRSWNQKLSLNGLKTKSKLGQGEFLKLLVAQLKHQDPLSPLKDKDFIAQMAQFSSLEQMTKMNTKMSSLIEKTGQSNHYHLMDKMVHWFNQLSGKLEKGWVSGIEKNGNQIFLNVKGQKIHPDDIIRVVSGKKNE